MATLVKQREDLEMRFKYKNMLDDKTYTSCSKFTPTKGPKSYAEVQVGDILRRLNIMLINKRLDTL